MDVKRKTHSQERLLKTRMGIAITLLVLVPSLRFATAGGFNLTEQGARAVGMGFAFTAQADDPSAVYYNPAGIVQLEGTQASTCLAAYISNGKFRSDSEPVDSPLFKPLGTWPGKKTETANETILSPHFFLTHKMDDDLSLGLGVFSNFGLVNRWPAEWEGRYILGGVESGLKTVTVNPVLAWRPVERLSLAVGPDLQYFDFKIRSKFPGTADADLDIKITGDNYAWGWNAALLYRLSEGLKFGVSYRSAIRQAFTGVLRVSGIQPIESDVSIEQPPICWSGIAWTVDSLTLEADIHWVGWSTFDVISIDLSSPLYGVSRITSQERWKDTLAYRFGASYRLSPRFELLTGISYDETPIRRSNVSPLLPGNNYVVINGGLSVHYFRFTVTTAYAHVHSRERTFDNAKGDYYADPLPTVGRITGLFYDVYAHLITLNVTCRF